MNRFPDLREMYPELTRTARGAMSANADLSRICWFRTGGPAQLLFQPADTDDLAAFLAALPAEVPVTVLGLGSNVLIREGGVEGVVIRLSAKGFGHIEVCEGVRLRVGAAVPDLMLAQQAAKAGIGGFSFYRGIPGAVGGALRMNAGCYGTETCERVVQVSAIDRLGGHHTFSVGEMRYSYRHSGVDDGLIFTEALFEGTKANREVLEKEMTEITHQRERSQPVKSHTGGSTFKNPNGHKAWQLIDAAGCRGLTLGGAQVSKVHCNFLINSGTATSSDIEALGEMVRTRVLEHSGVQLEWEIRRIGQPVVADEVTERSRKG